MANDTLPVAVIGSGPVGLAAAAHLIERGLSPIVLEARDEIAGAVAEWGHVTIFSPWRYNIDAAARRLLASTGWAEPDADEHPNGAELRERYLLPLAQTPQIARALRLGARVTGVTRLGRDKLTDRGRAERPFQLTVVRNGSHEQLLARAVIDASGTVSAPNPLGASGVPALGERELAEHIAYGVPNVLAARERFAGRRVLVVGSGHSAMNVVADLARLKASHQSTDIHWAIRRSTIGDLFGGGAADGLTGRGQLGLEARSLVREGIVTLRCGIAAQKVRSTPDGLVVSGEGVELPAVDEIVVATGFRPDVEIARELRLDLDPGVESPRALAPLIDPNFHSCGSVPPHGAAELAHPEPDFYIAGMKSYGRAPTFLMLTGYEQVRSIAAALAGDMESALSVELVLPETGVCRAPARGADQSSACCAVA